MTAYQVVLLPGDGIGPEVSSSARQVIEAAGVEIDWLEFPVGISALDDFGQTLPDEVLDAIRDCQVALKGPVTTPIGTGFKSVNISLRQKLGLYANLRPVVSLPGLPGRYTDVDLVIIRENTEGLYIGEEVEEEPGTIRAHKRVTKSASKRIAEFAFEYAIRNHRDKLTIVHKANILKKSDGLFLDTAREIAADYPSIQCEDRIVDALAMDLVIDPSRHDILLCPNLYGDIVSDLAAGLIGGLGLVPGANIGQEVSVFEAVHGSAPDIAGQGIANPTALIQASIMLLRHLGEIQAADEINQGLTRLILEGSNLTPDLGGQATTQEFTQTIINFLPT
jgi:isocitrate dehydrogenase (NAD+)